jgi:hypothetical protein
MHIERHGLVLSLGLLLVLFVNALVLAQTGPDLIVLPWEDGQAVQTSTDGLLNAQGHTREGDNDIRVSSYEAMGRWRLLPNNRATPRLGYDIQYWDIETSDPALPRKLWDMSIGFAQPVAEVNGWFAVLTGAVGYAGNSPFSDAHAWYPSANVIVGREFSKDRGLFMALNYNGNRTYLPDVPLPGFAYADRVNEQLTYVLGVPYSRIEYEPLHGFQVEAGYTLIDTLEAKLAYQFTKHWAVFGQYLDQLSPFHIDETKVDRRLFFHTHEVEVGVRWNPTKLIRLSVSGGWSFGQEFSNGFDDRSLNTVRHLSDTPFGRVRFEFGL